MNIHEIEKIPVTIHYIFSSHTLIKLLYSILLDKNARYTSVLFISKEAKLLHLVDLSPHNCIF